MPESASERAEKGRYRALLELGEGGAAKVYLASLRSDPSELVVLKALKAHLANEPELVTMFEAEAKLSQKLHHPNIVRVLEVIQTDATPVIVMEYLEGRSLSEIVQRAGDSLSLEQHLSVIARALDGLHYSHELTDENGVPLGVIHRDMTPHNVFVTYEGKVLLLDFGIAKVKASSVETETGVIKGKIRYMAPEQITREAIDRRADVFSVGVMLWEAATRTKLWRGVDDTQVMARVIEGEIPLPSSVRPCAPALERVISRALSLAPADRYPTVLALHEDLLAAVPALESVSASELGARVKQLFAREIAELDAAIARRRREMGTSADRSGVLTLPAPRVFANESRPEPPRAKSRAWLAIPLALLAFAFAWAASRSRSEVAAPHAAVTKPSAVELRAVQVTAFPAEARLWLDDQPLAENPAIASLPSGTTHRLRATAPGHAPAERSFVAEGPVTITLERLAGATGDAASKAHPAPSQRRLAPSASAAKAAPPAVSALPAVTTASAPAPAADPAPLNCEPPYFFDARGIKKYRPECL